MDKFNLTHYVPILRWKRGEQIALFRMINDDSMRLTPLVEMVDENFISPDGKLLDSDKATRKIVEQLVKYWCERPVFIDFGLLRQNILNQKSSHLLSLLGQYTKNTQLAVIPVTGLDRDARFQTALLSVISNHKQGACVRLTREDINRVTLVKDLNNILLLLKLIPEEVDLVVDFKIIDGTIPNYSTLCEKIPNIEKWRNFIVASGAFPEDLSGFEKNRIHRRQRRLDWLSWKGQINPKLQIKRIPNYSDYTIQYPQQLHRKGFLNISASIRYTADDYWVIMRGESIYNDRGSGPLQWPANALLLCDQPEYRGDSFSYGDNYIKVMSLEEKKTGNAESWLRAGINHHMTFVVRQLATLRGS